MRTAILGLVLAASAHAQPAFVPQATVDQATYAYGETITLTYTLRNDGDEPATVWSTDGCYPDLRLGNVRLDPKACPQAQTAITVAERGGTFVATWTLDPARLGIPVADGAQTVDLRLSGPCGPGSLFQQPTVGRTKDFSCDLSTDVTFQAPRFLGGTLDVSYAVADADSVASLKRIYHTVVTDSARSAANRSDVIEKWRITGTAVEDAAAALASNTTIEYASVYRTVAPELRFAVAAESGPSVFTISAPAPNPTASQSTFTVRLERAGPAQIDVVDLLGRRVTRLHDGPLAGGAEHTFTVSGEGLPAGVYVVRVLADGVRQSHRLTVAR